jgi:ketosteroid isomerase-like protein
LRPDVSHRARASATERRGRRLRTIPAVSQRDVEAVRRMFAAFAQRDIATLLEVLHPDIEFTSHATAELAGRSGPYRGHEGISLYFDDVAAVWDDLTVEPSDYRAVAGSVVIFGRVHARRGSETVDTGVIWTWRLRDGQVIWGSVFPTVDAGPAPERPAPSGA